MKTSFLLYSTTNANLVIAPNGTGALVASIPNGTPTGGNARGILSLDLQRFRTSATQVASGSFSVICGGREVTVSGIYSIIGAGDGNLASNNHSAVFSGLNNQATGRYAVIVGGTSNIVSGFYSSISGGLGALTSLYGQRANSSGQFAAIGDAQTSSLTFRNIITGTAKTELFLDATSARGVLSLPTGATAGRLWNAKIQIAAICRTQGDGTVTAGESFIGNYAVGISRIGTTTSLIGTVQNLHTPQTSTNMADAVVDITADDTNEALKIEFTPPTTAGSTTVIRVVATVYLTEVGY